MAPSAPLVSPAVAQAQRLAQAYLTVFGAPDTRTTDQKLVWADLEYNCFAYRPVHQIRGAGDGEVATTLAALNDGKRSIWIRIRGLLEQALKVPATIKVSRTRKKS